MGTQVITREKLEQLQEIRRTHARWAGGLGLGTVFIPLADIGVMGTVWTSLLVRTANACGHETDAAFAKKTAAALVKGTLLYLGGSRVLTSILAWTGLGAPAAMAANAALNYGYTWLLGGFLIEQFSKPEVELGSLATSAVAFMLSFGIGEVREMMALHDAADAATAAADGLTLADVAANTTDAHAAAGALDAHQVPGCADLHAGPGAADGAVHGTHAADAAASGATHHAWATSYRLPRFSGLEHTAYIAASQGQLPLCGAHALGNIAQLFRPGTTEAVNAFIVTIAAKHGGMLKQETGETLDPAHYEPILEQAFHIPAHWEVYDRERTKRYLNQNRGIVALGDGGFLDPERYDPESYHAFNLTDFRVDDRSGDMWYKGLDSNVEDRETWWPAENVESALDEARAVYGKNLLVTEEEVKWEHKNAPH